MRTVQQEEADIGVIVGRWQVDDLHEAHTSLIEEVRAQHKKVIVFVGLSDILGGTVDPLDYPTRAAMLQYHYPDLVVLPIQDVPNCNEDWSSKLDAAIRTASPIGTALLYGGRDSFVRHYTGKFPTVELDALRHPSGTEIRKEVGREVRASADFRAGVIYSTFNQYPRHMQVVDVAVLKKPGELESPGGFILLGRKKGDLGLRFPGGFVNANDASLEAAARREVKEETGVFPETVRYLGSFRVPDGRLAKTKDGMMSAFFLGQVVSESRISLDDDLDHAEWIPVDKLRSIPWYENHAPMFEALCKELGV